MKELPVQIQLNPEDKKHLYEQIYEYIRQEIRSGNLLTGEKLPSSRYLAEFLQISRTTVDMAYGQLVSEGYLEARPQRGYFVCAIEELYDIPASGEGRKQHRGEGLFAGRPGLPEAKHTKDGMECGKAYRYDFSPNAIDMSLFPYATWKKITKNILVDARSSLFSLGEPQGDLALRVTISRYLHASRGVNCRPEQIIIGAGNDYLLLLLEKILGRHIPVAMENPTYKRACMIFRSFAYPVSFIPMDENGMLPDALRKSGAQLAYVMPAHQYPTGIVMPIGRRTELLNWASEKSVILSKTITTASSVTGANRFRRSRHRTRTIKSFISALFPKQLHPQSVSVIWRFRQGFWNDTEKTVVFTLPRFPESTRRF